MSSDFTNSHLYGQPLASQVSASQAAMNKALYGQQSHALDAYRSGYAMECTGIGEGLVNQGNFGAGNTLPALDLAARAAPHADEADDELAKELAGRSGVLATATIPHPDVEGGVPLWKLFRPQATATLDKINPKRVELYEEKRQIEMMNQRAEAARAMQNQQLNSLAQYQTASTNWRNVYGDLEQAAQSEAVPGKVYRYQEDTQTPEQNESIAARLKSFINLGRKR